MNSINRKFGKLMSKGANESAKVSVLLNDYEDADSTLAKVSTSDGLRLYGPDANTNWQIIEASKAWRDAWVSILTVQLGLASTFEELYRPIVGTSDGHRDNPVLTPQEQLDRTARLKDVCLALKTDLMEEVIMMDSRVIRPATDAKELLQPLRKMIKKRENKRMDWERYIDRVNNASKKVGRSDRENAALAKAEEELGRASDVSLRISY
jgi:amphiphysin